MLGDIKETWATEDVPDSPEIDVSVQVVLPSEEEMRLLDFCQTFILGPPAEQDVLDESTAQDEDAGAIWLQWALLCHALMRDCVRPLLS